LFAGQNLTSDKNVMGSPFNHILIIADIEGSSGCWNYEGSSFMKEEWRYACVEMSCDIDGVVRGLFDAGVERITIKDFHRTGYNLLPELVDPRAQIVSGYIKGPVPGIGNPDGAEAFMLIGGHAASGTDGFLAHTLTSRIARLEVNGNPIAEVELFSASLAPFGLLPIFFSGCPVACAQAREAIKGICTYPIDKSKGAEALDTDSWRSALANAAVESLNNISTKPHTLHGPFKAVITMRDGETTARKLARRWGFNNEDDRILLETSDIHKLYGDLIRICYLTPMIEKVLPLGLYLFNFWGRLGLGCVRRRINSESRN
jgi:D-amino peptidase